MDIPENNEEEIVDESPDEIQPFSDHSITKPLEGLIVRMPRQSSCCPRR